MPAIPRHSSIIHNKSIFPFHRDRIMFNKENCFFLFFPYALLCFVKSKHKPETRKQLWKFRFGFGSMATFSYNLQPHGGRNFYIFRSLTSFPNGKSIGETNRIVALSKQSTSTFNLENKFPQIFVYELCALLCLGWQPTTNSSRWGKNVENLIFLIIKWYCVVLWLQMAKQ